ncbi:sacsin N-terminal ATP-binding-like domain-containing protein [Hymenobacter siberiensis]|uniref:sacsin N-terminal ATP-binding-like domain-containing protein n=1 Tax=Hymenobacter siberiensis TaxID=2848396 RepID=UPI001C1DD318|nr:hypothetical protein [Hymenobacter siberiensis]
MEKLLELSPPEAQAQLQEYWQLNSLEVIGCYIPHPEKSFGWFKELCNPTTGELLQLPALGVLPSAFVFKGVDESNLALEANKLYQFRLEITAPATRQKPHELLRAVAKSVRRVVEGSEQIISHLLERPELLQRRRAQLGDYINLQTRKSEIQAALARRTNLGDWGDNIVSGLLSQVSARLATASERMFWELLQNADDKPDIKGKPPTVTFRLLDNYLLFLHNGEPFSLADVEGISDATHGTKPEAENMTGYKGIGFKSVFAKSTAVYILSGGYSFRFKPEPTEDPDLVPWQVWPRWTELNQFPEEIYAYDPFFQSAASTVAIGLQMGSEQMLRYEALLPQVFARPTFLLFLRAIRTVRLEGVSGSLNLRRQDNVDCEIVLWANEASENYWRQDFVVSVPVATQELAQADKQMPPALRRATSATITLAVPLTDDGPAPVTADEAILYCYLPTTDRGYHLPALVNADFLTDPSRERVLPEKEWNNFLFEELGRLWPSWLASILGKRPEWAAKVYHLLPLLYTGPKLDANQQHFNTGFQTGLAKDAFIQTASGALVTPSEAVLDVAGLANVLPELYTKLLQGGKQQVAASATHALVKHSEMLGLPKIMQAHVIAALNQPQTAPGYSPEAAVNLLVYLQFSSDTELLTKLKTCTWLFDQNGKPLAPNAASQFGIIDEELDADMPYYASLRYLHADLQTALHNNLSLREWFEAQFPLLVALNRARAIEVIGAKISGGQITQEEAPSVANYLYKLHVVGELKLAGAEPVLSKLLVRTKSGQWLPIGQTYLSDFYQPGYPLEALAAELGQDKFSFIAKDYCTETDARAWGEFWGKMGARRPVAGELLTGKLLPLLTANQLAETSHDALAKFALQLYTNATRGELDSHWAKLGALRLRTKGGTRQLLTECLKWETYPEVPDLLSQLLPQGLPKMLATDYATSTQIPVAVVRQFLVDATAKPATTTVGLIKDGIEYLTSGGAPATIAESVRVVQLLAKAVSECTLSASLKSTLVHLPLFLKNGETIAAGRCYLGTEYQPLVDIEKLSGGVEKAVLSAEYLKGASSLAALKSFMTDWLKTREKFEPVWYPKVSIHKSTLVPFMEPYWNYAKTHNSTLLDQTIQFTSLLVVNNIELVKNDAVAAQFAAALTAPWEGKPEELDTPTYQIIGKSSVLPFSPWLDYKQGICLNGKAGRLPIKGERYLSKSLQEEAPKSAWVSMHSYGSPSMERYWGLQTELTLAERLEAFEDRILTLQQQVSIDKEKTKREFERLALPLLALFAQPPKDATLPTWKDKLSWLAADGSWHKLSKLYWLNSDAARYFSTTSSKLVLRIAGQISELNNFCVALGVRIVMLEDFQPEIPTGGGENQSTVVQQQAKQNQLMRLLIHQRLAYDNLEQISVMENRLLALTFLKVPAVQLVCSRIPDYVVPIEARCIADPSSKTFYFSGTLLNTWRHYEQLGKFISKQLSYDCSPLVLADLLRARNNTELRGYLEDAEWLVPDWLKAPEAQPQSASVKAENEPAANPKTSAVEFAADDDSTLDFDGDGGASVVNGSDLSEDKRKAYQREAREALEDWLGENGYNQANATMDEASIMKDVYHTATDSIWQIVVKSYRNGILYINPNEWITLAGENSFLLLYKPAKRKAKSAAFEVVRNLNEVLQRNPNIIVRMANTDPRAELNELTLMAEKYKLSKSFKYIFDSISNKPFDFELEVNENPTEPLADQGGDFNIN